MLKKIDELDEKMQKNLHLPQFNQVYGIVKSSIQSFFQKSQEKFISKKNVLLIVLIHLRKYYIFEDMVSFFGINTTRKSKQNIKIPDYLDEICVIDATVQTCLKPKNNNVQSLYYSGKHKFHCVQSLTMHVRNGI
ncbi:hypothetical protein M0811_06202 [Anaeramoeba ignava]|uniref:Uncharacterized protein n=1 Tax=Anaeramoeba ignava TaxID=1746090 RepID=A0A9Q0LPD6_ANAIG|nr:hypothetical protein M0811_06202 [Anaeramoeba ignava]